jgi:glutamate-ammonia-ligase adenylyltransferase
MGHFWFIDRGFFPPYNVLKSEYNEQKRNPMTQIFSAGDVNHQAFLEEKEAETMLAQVGFSDWRAAYRILLRLAPDAERQRSLVEILPHLIVTLAGAAGPDSVLVSMERYMSRVSDPASSFRYLSANPRAVEILVTLFSGSQFLTEILLRNPDYFERLVEFKRLAAKKSGDQFYTEARDAMEIYNTNSEKLGSLRQFQSWEFLRIGICDLLDFYDLSAVTRQLSNLADSLIRACLKIAAIQCGVTPDFLTVIAMGKLGGGELNYSSDIDLFFLTGQTIEIAQKVGEHLIDALARVTDQGYLYRVDMRLRPWGKVGPLVSTIPGYNAYLRKNARLWEKQALLKARIVAGDQTVGKIFLQQVKPLIFGTSIDRLQVELYGMRQRTEAQLRLNGHDWGEVKLGEGSIRDVEFTVQLLQLSKGESQPEILTPNTLDALARLSTFKFISFEEYRILTDGYIFQRTIEHFLQLMHYHQTHSLPQEPEAISLLARRLGFRSSNPGDNFLARYRQHVTAIRSVYLRFVRRSDMPINPVLPPLADDAPLTPPEVHRHLDRMTPSYSERFLPNEIAHHAFLAGQLNENHLVEMDVHMPGDDFYQVTLVAYDFPGELSLICGLMFIYGLNILNGDAFTYEPSKEKITKSSSQDPRRKIVDVFTVQPVNKKIAEDLWARYAFDLEEFLRMLRSGQRREVQGELAKRVVASLQDSEQLHSTNYNQTLYPISIQIDNEISDQYTILKIESTDSFGFLYELTNALAITHIYISRVSVDSTSDKVQDTLYVTDENEKKITDPDKQRELRAATVLIKHFSHLLPLSPNPESALLHFREFIGDLFKHANWPAELTSLERPEVLNVLAQLLGVSDFLWDDFLRMQYQNLFPVVRNVDALETAKTRTQLQKELEIAMRPVHNGPQSPTERTSWIGILNAYKDREMFRIDMRHILGHTNEFWEFAAELADLTEVFVNAVFHLCHEDLRLVYGTPCLENGLISQMTVAALGKFGGREMGFASDIELMFIYTGNGKTSGPNIITTTEFYEKLVHDFVSAVSARREGIFEIDLQLRPYGKAGSLAVSVDSFRRYFAPNGPAWAYERQSLVRLRPVAGDMLLGKQIADLRDEFVYTGDPFDVTAMRAMREKQIRHLVRAGSFNPKFSLGGLVDVEYLIQALQINHGHTNPNLRLQNTREAMAALTSVGILNQDVYTRLRKAHTFLRWLIDSMRVVRGNARDVTMPKKNSEEFAFLARRMRYGKDIARLHSELERFTEDVRRINADLLK